MVYCPLVGSWLKVSKIVVRLDDYGIMNNAVHDHSSDLIASDFQSVPPKSIKHLRNTAIYSMYCMYVLIHHKSGSSTLYHFN